MNKEEKILLVDVVLQDVKGDWSRNLVERVDYVRNLCREIGGKFNVLAKDCDKFLENNYTDGRFFRDYFPHGYEGLQAEHGLDYRINDRSKEFKEACKELMLYPEYIFYDVN